MYVRGSNLQHMRLVDMNIHNYRDIKEENHGVLSPSLETSVSASSIAFCQSGIPLLPEDIALFCHSGMDPPLVLAVPLAKVSSLDFFQAGTFVSSSFFES